MRRGIIRQLHSSSRLYNLRNDLKVSSTEDEIEITVKPIERLNEKLETKRARLLYQSRKRGILETDLLLSRFAAKYLKGMSEKELLEYDKLLDLPDWDIYYWATGDFSNTPLAPEWKDSALLKLLQEFSLNKDKELLRMPELSLYK